MRYKITRFFTCLMLCFLLILVSACTNEGEKVIQREVLVTQLVEVTREVPIDIIREVEVTREVVIEVTRLVVEATDGETQATEQITEQVVTNATGGASGEQPTIVAVSEQVSQPTALATTISIAGGQDVQTATCWRWEEAPQHLGENGCVEGIVSNVGESPSAFFINFSPERSSFYAVSFDWAWEELSGECLRLNGTISEYQGRTQLIIEEPSSQVHYCGNDQDGPPAFER